MAIKSQSKMRSAIGLAGVIFTSAILCAALGAAQEQSTLPGSGKTGSGSLFGRLYGTYRPKETGSAPLNNTQDLSQMIQSGRIRLSMAQLRKVVRDNNLDITS